MMQQTDGSALHREQIAAHIRELLIAAPIELAEGELDPELPQPLQPLSPQPLSPQPLSLQPLQPLLPSPLVTPAVTATNGAPDQDPMHALWISTQPPRFSGFGDLQSPEGFIEKLESYCLIQGVKPEDRISRVVPAVLDGSAKLWFRFAGEFTSWGSFVTAFHSQFAPVDKKKRLKEELRKRTQHPEENLKQFIYVISSYYDRIGEPVTDAQKVERVLRQMHPQFRDLVEGRTFATLKELADAADGLMERVWRRLQYVPPPQLSNQVARDLVFQSRTATPVPRLVPVTRTATPVTRPVPVTDQSVAAWTTPTLAAPNAYPWCLHPAALQPSYYRDQLGAVEAHSVASSQTGFGSFGSPVLQQAVLQENSYDRQLQCHRCGGVGHMSRQCPTSARRSRGRPRCFRCNEPGHMQASCPGNGRQ
ncbi:hypothetical protein ISCGN_033194 [Ixodes scapularis]